jgi:deazaflavin-dependent oxidoreductase (nitroreductase family)
MANKLDPLAKLTNRVHPAVFAATRGRVGGRMKRVELVMLTTTGRKSGRPRRSMVAAPIIGDDKVVVVGSFGGAPNHPQWVLNLRANPILELTRRGTTRSMRAREADGEEREALWARVVGVQKSFATYQAKTDRQIPVVVLEPVP